MNSSEITFENMSDKLVEVFPELKDRHDKETEWLDSDNHYLLYSFVFYRYIEDMLKSPNPNDQILHRMFEFIEQLVAHENLDVRDVAHHSICTKIVSSELVLQKAQKYMGAQTKKLCAGISSDAPGPNI